ncbi:hypothetical protein [Nonomuraea salmonea]|uniref:hypothetical protein n=1 Tax=Nonomuraea salmonea TaxID=46181 RepID=UPI002FEAD684
MKRRCQGDRPISARSGPASIRIGSPGSVTARASAYVPGVTSAIALSERGARGRVIRQPDPDHALARHAHLHDQRLLSRGHRLEQHLRAVGREQLRRGERRQAALTPLADRQLGRVRDEVLVRDQGRAIGHGSSFNAGAKLVN